LPTRRVLPGALSSTISTAVSVSVPAESVAYQPPLPFSKIVAGPP